MKGATLSTDIHAACELLRAGKVVSFPTETVYGLGADAGNPLAVRGIFELKGRPADHPLIVHLADSASLAQWASEVPEDAYRLAEHFWPGPLTLILPKAAAVPLEVTGGQDTIGLRVPDHPLALELLRTFGGGLAAPSANRFGRISPTSANHVRDELGDRIEMILDGGDCQVGLESTIISLVDNVPRLLRPGGIPAAEVSAVLGGRLEFSSPAHSRVRAPGMLSSHYAPTTPLELWPGEELWPRVHALIKNGERPAVMTLAPAGRGLEVEPGIAQVVMPSTTREYARQLYATLRTLDAGGHSRLLVEIPPATGEWLAIQDRLRRAATPA